MYADKRKKLSESRIVMNGKVLPAEVFGKALKELRLERGFTQDKLAELAGTERSHISALERAEKSPALNTIFVLANALSMTASQLIESVEKQLSGNGN